MSETCRFCGKTELDWDLDKDGNSTLFNPSGQPHKCRSRLRREYLKACETDEMMKDYVNETIGPMHEQTAACLMNDEEATRRSMSRNHKNNKNNDDD